MLYDEFIDVEVALIVTKGQESHQDRQMVKGASYLSLPSDSLPHKPFPKQLTLLVAHDLLPFRTDQKQAYLM
jgi:hypothetical protein